MTGHPARLFEINRKPEAFGHFAVVNLNGEKSVIDVSLPHEVDKLPRDAKQIDPEIAEQYWHDESGNHTFGGPDVARALRESIAEVNGANHRADTGR